MVVEFLIDCAMRQVVDSEYMGSTHIGYSDELITFKYNSKTKRGYILNGNRWRWIRPQMTPVTVGSITVKQAWPGKRVFTIIAETEEIPNPE